MKFLQSALNIILVNCVKRPGSAKPMPSRTLHPDVSSTKRSRRLHSDGGNDMNRHPHPNPNADSKNEWNTQSKLGPSPSPVTATIATGSLESNEHDADADRQTAGWTSAGPVKAQRSLPVPPPVPSADAKPARCELRGLTDGCEACHYVKCRFFFFVLRVPSSVLGHGAW